MKKKLLILALTMLPMLAKSQDVLADLTAEYRQCEMPSERKNVRGHISRNNRGVVDQVNPMFTTRDGKLWITISKGGEAYPEGVNVVGLNGGSFNLRDGHNEIPPGTYTAYPLGKLWGLGEMVFYITYEE